MCGSSSGGDGGFCPPRPGREFYGYALHIASLFDEMETRIKNWDRIGTLRIGTSITIGTHILPELLYRFQEQFPEVRTEAEINNSSLIERRVLDNAIDVGLIENQPEHEDICAVPLCGMSWQLSCRPGMRLAAGRK